jgi:hypothetical protein
MHGLYGKNMLYIDKSFVPVQSISRGGHESFGVRQVVEIKRRTCLGSPVILFFV